jgi:16S rRNA (guanine966-N2)-methyltransferase
MARGLRVVGGSAGGLQLVAPKGARPTTDRTKEALFSSLGSEPVDGVAVLDLYAGSGALGIEALSRGAASAVFVDRDRQAAAAIRANLASTGFDDRGRVVSVAVATFARGATPAPFGLVFLDPPYDQPAADTADVLASLAAPGWLTAGATVVIECRADKGRAAATAPSRPELPAGWRVGRERAYGDTLLVVATVSAGPPGRPHWS